ncbi:MAG: hypothetical protein ACFCU6_02895 [Balneolaceae bacterium]
MFSIGQVEERGARPPGFFSMLGVSLDFADFSFRGSGLAERDRLDFNDNILNFKFENPGIDINIGLGGSATGMSNNSYVNLRGLLYNDFVLHRSSGFRFAIPLQISTDFTRINRDITDFEFEQTSFSIGSGFNSAVRLTDRFQLTGRFTPNVGFSAARGTFFGGTLYSMQGRLRFVVDNFFGNNGLAIGYDFDFRDYDVDDDRFDNRFVGHGVTIGFIF